LPQDNSSKKYFSNEYIQKAIYMPSIFDGLVKSPKNVMPDLIRHPEHIEITGFPPSRE
jgi:hypothetical protein